MLLASVALFGSCEDFLSKEDPNKIDAPSYFRNETDLQTYVNGFLQTMSPTAASVATGDARTDCLAWRGEYQFLTDNFDADDQSGWGTRATRSPLASSIRPWMAGPKDGWST